MIKYIFLLTTNINLFNYQFIKLFILVE